MAKGVSKNHKAIGLLSGGLDSRLAMKILKEQGIEITIVNFVTSFCNCTSKGSCQLEAQGAAKDLGLEVKVINSTQEFLEVVKAPKHGYGSNMNPCIDCRILMFSKARDYMEAIGASFIITGEVLGQRPMSQHLAAMQVIEKESGLKGLILRPLSAQLLQPTVPEEKGWVDRKKLLAIRGRSRKPQIQLAEELGVKDYPCPAGGCLLTDPEFAKKIRDLVDHQELNIKNVHLLKLGRHFRLDDQTKIIVGRNEQENNKLSSSAQADDLLFEINQGVGPLTLLRGKDQQSSREMAASLIVYYSKLKESDSVEVKVFNQGKEAEIMRVNPASSDLISRFKI